MLRFTSSKDSYIVYLMRKVGRRDEGPGSRRFTQDRDSESTRFVQLRVRWATNVPRVRTSSSHRLNLDRVCMARFSLELTHFT
jgi:hypothetical protein